MPFMCKKICKLLPRIRTNHKKWLGKIAFYCGVCARRIGKEFAIFKDNGRAFCPCCGSMLRWSER